MGRADPLGKNLNFLSPLGSLKFQGFLSFLFILKLSYSKPFYYTLNYASTANIEDVMKFYNLGDKTFERDFSRWYQVSLHLIGCLFIIYYTSSKFLLYITIEFGGK